MLFHPLSRSLFICAALICGSVSASWAADSRSGMVDRLDRLERDLQMLQRNYYRDGAPSSNEDTPVKTNIPVAGAARFEVQINEIQTELREVRGQLEEMDFQQRRLNEKFDLLEKDVDLRLGNVEKSQAVRAPVVSSRIEVSDDTGTETVTFEPKEAPAAVVEEQPAQVVKAPAPYENAKEHYNAAFKELNSAKYESSASLFADFIDRYPKDSLIGNAYYWLGETYYVRKEYPEAANQFRLGFEKMPEGPKAADNLLKLAMSLSAIDRTEESCVVLKQLIKKYGGVSEVVDRKAKKERTKLACE